MEYLNQIPLKIRFVLVGGMNTCISYVMFIVLLFVLGNEKYQLSLALAWFFSSFISFTLQKIIVFQSKGEWIAEYIRCLLSWGIAYAINAVLLEITVQYLSLSPMFAQILAICITTVSTYFLFKHFAFKKKGNT